MWRTFDITFNVNRESRTVEAVAKKPNSRTAFYGTAICAPDDCFNIHIGEAIALHRALGLEVPDEYLNAPQPTEVRVGDVVRIVTFDGRVEEFTVGKLENGKAYDADYPGAFSYLDAQKRHGLPCTNPKIIDDSRTEVVE